jgi:HK97 family phage portal protein
MPLISLNLSGETASTASAEKRDGSQVNVNGLFAAAWSMLTNTLPTSSGEMINEALALQHVSVYAAVRVIAESVGSLTFRLYKRMPKGRLEAVDDPIHRMLTIAPNDEMSAPVMWESIAGCMALTGNSYLEILRNASGQPVGIYPLHPLQTEPVRLPNGKLAYKTTVGLSNGQARIIAAADTLHFPLFSWDGLKGLSPIAQARQTIGLARASEKFGSKFFGNGSRPGGLLTPVGEINEKGLANFKKFWESANGGENQGRIGVLPNDWKYTQVGLSPEDSQFLQTRQFSRTDIAALFRLQPHQIGDTSRLSNSNAEQASLSFVTDCLRPYLVRIEKEIARKLLPVDGSYFAEFDVSERLRGDFASTMAGFAVGKQWGFYNTNVVLEKLGENPIGPEGDIYWAPVNMQNAARMLDTESIQDQPLGGPTPAPPEPTPAQRSMFNAYIPAFTGLFNDAVGRITIRSKRDAETITPILLPVLESISQIVVAEARSQFRLPDAWEPSDKIIRDCIKSVSTRTHDWTPETKQQNAGSELNKAIRSIHLNIYREAGAAVALIAPPIITTEQ